MGIESWRASKNPPFEYQPQRRRAGEKKPACFTEPEVKDTTKKIAEEALLKEIKDLIDDQKNESGS